MFKLNLEWKISELFAHRNYFEKMYSIDENSREIYKWKERLNKIDKKIIALAKKTKKKELKEKDLPKFEKEIEDFFYKSKLVNEEYGRVPILGPIGSMRIQNGKFLDLEDVLDVYVYPEDISGSIKTKSCGWIGWMILKGDYNIQKSLTSKYVTLTTMNHFKEETCRQELFKKKLKYENPENKFGRGLKRFFYSNRFWFHDDLEQLYESLKYYRNIEIYK